MLAGDIVDDKAIVLEERGIGESFRKLKSKYGVYSINGNHEFINEVESCVRLCRKIRNKISCVMDMN